jgi:membrane dipeptidase
MNTIKRILKGLLSFVALITIVIGLRIALGWVLQLAPHPHEHAYADVALQARALELHQDVIIVDGHNDVAGWILDHGFDLGMDGDEPGDRYPFFYNLFPPLLPHGENVGTHLDLARAREGGLDVQFFSIFVDCSTYESGIPGQSRQRALDMIAALQESAHRNLDEIEFAYTVQDIERIVSEGRLAAITAIEGGYAIEDDLETLGEFYKLGVRYMTLTHTCSHAWADSSTGEDLHGGLSEFGRQVVQEMNRLGMIVDISHISDEAVRDVLEVTSAPVIASHSNARAMAESPRNLPDDLLRAVADNNGVVMVNFMNYFVDPARTALWGYLPRTEVTGSYWFTHPRHPETPLSLMVDHIDHIVQVTGIDHVGLGSDFDGTPMLLEDLKDVSDFPNITAELVSRSYSDEDIRKILGGNVLRVLADVEAVAAQP